MAVGVRAGAGIAGLGLLPGCQLVLDFSSLGDAGGPDAGAPDGPAGPRFCDVLEPNEALADAQSIDTGSLQMFDASICPSGDVDFYRFALDGTQDLSVLVTFASGANDLELELYSASGVLLVFSSDQDGDELIVRSAAQQGSPPAAGDYTVRVFGRSDAAVNDYQLTWTRGPLPLDAGAL